MKGQVRTPLGRCIATAASVLFWATLAAACSTGRTQTPSRPALGAGSSVASGQRHGALVTRVIDGDTIEVRLGSREVDVRLIGVDTPETVAPGQPVECGGPAASRFTEQRLEGREVDLEFDVERLDRYGRTLAYVWVGDELFNETLVARGFAQVATYPPDVRYVDRFVTAQRRARAADRGLWRACVG